MAILKVARMGHPVLREGVREVSPAKLNQPDFQHLVEDMIETMAEYSGVGLAGPQVHVPLRIFIFLKDTKDAATVLVAINPLIRPIEEKREINWEGCLSVPDIYGQVPRNVSVRLGATDAMGNRYETELSGLAARVCQHEADHLDGVLFLDRMEDFSTLAFGEERQRFWGEQEESEESEEAKEAR